ncbi:MAG: hypothetical protein J3K34DRAFT_416361 [Monoraphidium minutum]|nr:MAG: hypothetical protein J3K34DRAFT_416361 [Monoraphidium minutum]
MALLSQVPVAPRARAPAAARGGGLLAPSGPPAQQLRACCRAAAAAAPRAPRPPSRGAPGALWRARRVPGAHPNGGRIPEFVLFPPFRFSSFGVTRRRLRGCLCIRPDPGRRCMRPPPPACAWGTRGAPPARRPPFGRRGGGRRGRPARGRAAAARANN